MLELFEKIILAGSGLITMTKEKAEQLVDAMIAKGQLHAKDKKTMINRLIMGTQQFDKEMDRRIRDTSLGVVKNTEKQIDALHRKVAKLAGELEKAKKAAGAAPKKKTVNKKNSAKKVTKKK